MIEVTIPLFQLQLENRKRIFARLGTDFVAGAILSQGQVGAAFSQGWVQISWQAQHFRKAGYRFRSGRRDSFAW